jgi:hypothetical protein
MSLEPPAPLHVVELVVELLNDGDTTTILNNNAMKELKFV